MKRIWSALALLILCLLAPVSCRAGTVPLTVSQIPWADDEELSYIVEDSAGNTIGSGTLSVEREDDTFRLVQYFELVAEGAIIHTAVEVDATDLRPISGAQTVHTPDAVMDVITSYSRSEVGVTITVDGAEQSAELDIPEDAYDNDEVLFLLRAIPLEVGYSANYTNVVPQAGLTPKATVSVVSEEDVETPAGNLHCYHLEVKALGITQHLWYGAESPHYMVRYDNGQGTIIILAELP